MKRLFTNAVLSVALVGVFHPAQAEKMIDGGRVLSGAEVKELFSGKTVEYHHERRDFDAVAYHAPDGNMRGKRGSKTFNLEWSVNNEGELCVHKSSGDYCRWIVEKDGTYKKYKIKGNGDALHVVTYKKFIDGNPQGL